MCPLAACRDDVGYRSIEAFECYCGSILTPSFRRSTAPSGRTIKYLRYGFKRWRYHYKLAECKTSQWNA